MAGLRFSRRRYEKVNYTAVKKVLFWIVEILLVIILAFLAVQAFGIRTSVIGQSMSPVLKNKDQVLINRVAYKISKPNRFDLIVFKLGSNEKSHSYVKRVIGLPGETVQIKDGKAWVDGEILDGEEEKTKIKSAGIASEPIKLGKDEYFVLGDNRNNSEDSRIADIGNIKKNQIEGRAWFRMFPVKRFGFIK